MNTVIFFASPNKNGNTYKILERFMGCLSGNIDVINVYESNIRPCIDCGYCRKFEGKCSIKDDMEEIYAKIDCSDNIVIASPMYFGMFPSPMKAIIDRSQMIWSRKYIFNKISFKKKKGILIAAAGDSWTDMFIPMEKISKYFFNTVDCELTSKIYEVNTDKLHTEVNKQVMDYACEIARYISKKRS